jgi:hypothetical protein
MRIRRKHVQRWYHFEKSRLDLTIVLKFILMKQNLGRWRAAVNTVKVKLSRYRPGVTQRVGWGLALLFHDRGTRRGWAVSSTPRPHFTHGKKPVPIVQEVGWAPGPVWTGGKPRPHRDSAVNTLVKYFHNGRVNHRQCHGQSYMKLEYGCPVQV